MNVKNNLILNWSSYEKCLNKEVKQKMKLKGGTKRKIDSSCTSKKKLYFSLWRMLASIQTFYRVSK